jgi:hypothetical protein
MEVTRDKLPFDKLTALTELKRQKGNPIENSRPPVAQKLSDTSSAQHPEE